MITRQMVIACALSLFLVGQLQAQDSSVPPGEGTLQAAIDTAQPGDKLYLQAGIYQGPFVINKTLTLISETESILDGGGRGRVLTIDAPDVKVSGLMVRHSGDSLATEDSGIFVTAKGENVIIERSHLENNLIGIYLKGPDNAWVRNNTIVGSLNPRVNERGNGVHIWNAPRALVENNTIRYGRDGIFVTTSRHNVYRENHFQELRFAIHFMYTNFSKIIDNVSIGNHSAWALMFSDNLKVHGNQADGARDRGLFLNFVNNSEFRSNRVDGGTEKCVFIYNANFNQFTQNRFKSCDIGIHFTAGSEKNIISANTFIDNRTQVKYVGTRHIEWSSEGVGNYWSDNPAFDLDNDGVADRPYKPNDLVDQIVWRYPLAKFLLNSPATQLIRWAQSEFPAIHPGGVIDSVPLMQAPEATPQLVDNNTE